MTRPALSPIAIASAVLGVLIIAALTLWALSAMAKPKDFDRRMAVVEAQLVALAQSSSTRQASAYSAGALCSTPLVPAANAMQDELGRQAAASGLSMTQISVAPGDAAAPSPGLSAMDLVLTVEGPYASARRFLGGLQASSPEVFVDSFELRPAGAQVRLRVTGRAFCWISSRP